VALSPGLVPVRTCPGDTLAVHGESILIRLPDLPVRGRAPLLCLPEQGAGMI
jgi:hypothetical protein